MKFEEVLEYFGTIYKIATRVGFSMNTPRNWKKIGYIPLDAQARIQNYTKGALQMDTSDFTLDKKRGRKPKNVD